MIAIAPLLEIHICGVHHDTGENTFLSGVSYFQLIFEMKWRWMYYGFNTTMQAPWGMQFTTSLNMSSRRGYSDASLNTNELIWNAQISQSFLKGKPLSIMLQFYDILRQQSNLSRTINAMSRTDTEYNSINSYVMLHAVYRLNLFGTKEARQQMRMGPGGPDGERGGRGGNRGGGRGGFGGGRYGGGRF